MGLLKNINTFFNNKKFNKLKQQYIVDFKKNGYLSDVSQIQEFISKKDIKIITNKLKFGDDYDYVEELFGNEEDIVLHIKENRKNELLTKSKKLPDIVSDCAWQGELVYESDRFKELKEAIFFFDNYYSVIENSNNEYKKIEFRSDFETSIEEFQRMNNIIKELAKNQTDFDSFGFSQTMCNIIKAYSIRELNTNEDFKTKEDIILKTQQVLDNIFNKEITNDEVVKENFAKYARAYPSKSTVDFFNKIDNIAKLEKFGINIDLNETRISYIDASDEEKNKLFYEQLEKRKLDISADDLDVKDVAMIRTTPYITKELEMETIDELNSRVYHDNFLSSKLGEEYKTLSTMYRSTKHFTLNGLVGSHEYGNFSGNPYIFIDGLQKHIDKENMLSLDEADTYFKISREAPFKLSSDAEIMMPIEEYLKIKDDKEIMKEVSLYKNLTLFSGDEKTAVDMRLAQKGYIPESIGKWGYDYDSKMEKVIEKISKQYNKTSIRHFGSDIQREDYEKWEEMEAESNEKFVNAIFEKFNIEEKYKKDAIKQRLSDEDLDKIISNCGEDNLKSFITEFNERTRQDLDKKRDAFYASKEEKDNIKNDVEQEQI